MKTYQKISDFDESELQAYAVGKPMPHIAQFFSEHPDEYAIWKEQENKFAKLHYALYRYDCPLNDTLRDYYWRDLPSEQIDKIQQHLAKCPYCTEEFIAFEQLMQLDESAASFQVNKKENPNPLQRQFRSAVEHVGLMIAKLISPPLSLANASFRNDEMQPTYGDVQSVQLFEIDDVTISLAIQRTKTGFCQIAGQIFPFDSERGGQYKLAPLLKSGEQFSGLLFENGVFEIEKIPTGEYQLLFSLEEVSILIPGMLIQ